MKNVVWQLELHEKSINFLWTLNATGEKVSYYHLYPIYNISAYYYIVWESFPREQFYIGPSLYNL